MRELKERFFFTFFICAVLVTLAIIGLVIFYFHDQLPTILKFAFWGSVAVAAYIANHFRVKHRLELNRIAEEVNAIEADNDLKRKELEKQDQDIAYRSAEVALKQKEKLLLDAEIMLKQREYFILEYDQNGNLPVWFNAPQLPLTTFPTGNNGRMIQAPAIQAPATNEPVSIPSFLDLLNDGRIDPRVPSFPLGFSRDGMEDYTVKWNGKFGALIVGLPGSGKSVSVAYLTAIDILFGARLLIIDPDPTEPESITMRLKPFHKYLLSPVGISDSAESVRRVVECAMNELDHPNPHYSVVFIVEELPTMVMKESQKDKGWEKIGLIRCIEEYARRGRKKRRAIRGITQIANVSRVGNSIIRATLPNKLIHRVPADQARLLGMDLATQRAVSTLQSGELFTVWDSITVPQHMHMCEVDHAALREVVRLRDLCVEGTVDYTEEFTKAEDDQQPPAQKLPVTSGSLGTYHHYSKGSGILLSRTTNDLNTVSGSLVGGTEGGTEGGTGTSRTGRASGTVSPSYQGRTTAVPALYQPEIMQECQLSPNDPNIYTIIDRVQELRRAGVTSLRKLIPEVYRIEWGGSSKKFKAALEELKRVNRYLDKVEVEPIAEKG